jgi:hypothetical protein
MRNRSQPLVPEQLHDADDQARDPNLALFADLVTVPGTYADTVLNAGGFAFLAQLSQDNRLFRCAITICQLLCLHANCIARFAMPLNWPCLCALFFLTTQRNVRHCGNLSIFCRNCSTLQV